MRRERRRVNAVSCRWCEYSSRVLGEWVCSQGVDPLKLKGECKEFYCGERDKINGNLNRKSRCFVCGRPVYSHGIETSIYCKEHKHYADKDNAVFDDVPPELLYPLISGIFIRAREDYIFNADGKRSDAEVFLRSQWAQDLSVAGFNVDEVFATLEMEMADEARGTDKDSE